METSWLEEQLPQSTYRMRRLDLLQLQGRRMKNPLIKPQKQTIPFRFFDYTTWLAKAGEDPDLIQELEQIKSDAGQVSDRFYRNLEFGTG